MTIPAHVEEVQNAAFFKSARLARVDFLGNAPYLEMLASDGVADGFTVYHKKDATGFNLKPWADYKSGILK